MRQYEVTFVVDPRLSGDEVKTAVDTYVDLLKKEGSNIVHIDEMGLKELAYSINRRDSGYYFSVEFQNETGAFMEKVELSFRRDERILRFLTVKLDKYGVKYNEDKRNGLIGKRKEEEAGDEAKAETPAEKTKDKAGA